MTKRKLEFVCGTFFGLRMIKIDSIFPKFTGKSEIVFVMGQANKVLQMKLSLFLVIWVHNNIPQPRNLQTDIIS